MQFKTKRLVSLVMSLIALFSLNLWSSTDVSAAESSIQPRLQYTAYTTTSMVESSGGTLTCLAEAEGYSGTTTKVHIKMELQQHNMIEWVTVATWEGTFNTYYGTLSKTKTLTEAGLCRVKATYTVYSGSAYETITSYSEEDFIIP